MDISIIICTYNRADSLRKTFESLIRLDIPANTSIELLLVDNNSSDATWDVVAHFQPLAPFSVRYIFEEQQGLSYARNRGVREAVGKILAFTDDDVLIENDWLVNIRNAFAASDLACAGGKIFPLWEKECPTWLTRDLYNYLALLDLGDMSKQLNEPKVYGANFIVRASMFAKYGPFETSIGRTRGKLYAGEESEFIERLLAGGEKVCYIPGLVVHHLVPAKRMQKSYFRRWICDNSELAAVQMGTYSKRNIAGVPFYSIREFLVAMFDYVTSAILMKQTFKKELSLIQSSMFIASRLKHKLI
jgi:glucosyl-dolichyl phosphate glucuronosyltransferase